MINKLKTQMKQILMLWNENIEPKNTEPEWKGGIWTQVFWFHTLCSFYCFKVPIFRGANTLGNIKFDLYLVYCRKEVDFTHQPFPKSNAFQVEN